MQKGSWSSEEVISLFSAVEEAKDKNISLKFAFIEHAKKYSRQPNSVRNYYYHEVDNLYKDKARKKELGIDLEKHKKSSIRYFSQEQESELMKKIEELVSQGNSVRKACFTLAKGDVGEMLRYQNKYRNFLAKKKPSENNIIKFTQKKKEGLSESDLNSLFLGLVRLVKKSALEEVNEKFREEKENANSLLRQALIDLGKKEREILSLKESFLKLKKENETLIKSMMVKSNDKTNKLSEKLKNKRDKVDDKTGG